MWAGSVGMIGFVQGEGLGLVASTGDDAIGQKAAARLASFGATRMPARSRNATGFSETTYDRWLRLARPARG